MFVHPNFDPVAVKLGPVSIHWYGLMYLLGFAGCWYLGTIRARQPGAAPSEHVVRGVSRGRRAACGAVVVWPQAAAAHGGRGTFPPAVRRVPLRRRIRAPARRAHRLSRVGLGDDGHRAVDAD